MDPGSPSLLWPLRLAKPAVTVAEGGEHSKAEDRPPSPSLADRLASSPPASPPAPPSPAPPQHQFQAALVAEKYLLLEQVEGSSLCRCVDVRTQEEYVCKVSILSLENFKIDTVSSCSVTQQIAWLVHKLSDNPSGCETRLGCVRCGEMEQAVFKLVSTAKLRRFCLIDICNQTTRRQ